MSKVDDAIARAEARNQRAIIAATGADAMDAWDDCTILAAEVKRLRESLESASAPTVGAHNRAVAQRRFQ